jgi:hypothetical protein
VKGHSSEGWTQYVVKSGAELEGPASITKYVTRVTGKMYRDRKKSPSSAPANG